MKKQIILILGLAAGMAAGHPTLGQEKTKKGAIDLLPVEIIYPEEESSEALSVFPNPATDRLEIRLMNPEPRGFRLEVWDQRGKKLMAKDWNGQALEISDLENGVYVLRLTKNRERFSTKFIVKR